MKQTERVLAHIQKHGYITPLIARQYGIERLTSRIYDLKKQGHRIVAETKRDDLGRRYTEYRMAPPEAVMRFGSARGVAVAI